MKPVLFLILISTFSCLGLAADLNILERPPRYCDPENPPPNEPGRGGGTIDCINEAYSGPFSKDESMALCQGAFDTSPALCATKAYSGPFLKAEALQLCTYARSEGPALCAIEAYSGPFSRAEALDLCQRNGSLENAQCAIKAYNGVYSREEALRLCRSEPRLMLRSLRLMESSPEIQSKVKLMKSKSLLVD